MSDAWLDEVPWNEHGLVAAIAQDAASGKVLTLAWMNREALAETAKRGEAVYWSRSRNRLWRKGGDAATSYVARLLAEGEDAVLKKIGEEATETVLAAKGGDRLHLVRETADLWFHSMILLSRHGLGPGDVLAELHRREGIPGLDEKAARKKK